MLACPATRGHGSSFTNAMAMQWTPSSPFCNHFSSSKASKENADNKQMNFCHAAGEGSVTGDSHGLVWAGALGAVLGEGTGHQVAHGLE